MYSTPKHQLSSLPKNYEPTLEDVYRKQLSVDERLCFVEVIDTAGQREIFLIVLSEIS
jgi:hypothetical protein